MKIFSTLLAITIATLFISGCSDDTTTNNTTTTGKDFMPLTVGNYWIYSRTTIDTLNATVGTAVTDSAAITQNGTFHGKSASQLVYFTNEAGATNDTTYFYKGTDNTLYTWFSADTSIFEGTVSGVAIPGFWTKIYSADKQPWSSFDTTLKNVAYGAFSLDVKLTVSGKVTNDTTVMLGGKSYAASQSQLNFAITAYAAGTTTQLMNFVIPQNFIFIEGVGAFQMYTPATKISVFGSVVSAMNGSKSVLQSYKLK